MRRHCDGQPHRGSIELEGLKVVQRGGGAGMGRRKYYISVRASWPGTWFGRGPKLPIERSRTRIAVGIPTNRSHPLQRKNEVVINILAMRAMLCRGERMGSKIKKVHRQTF